MTRYFFDTRDNDRFVRDDDGLEFPDLEVAKSEAARAIGEMARLDIPDSERHTLLIEVRGEAGPIFTARLVFEFAILDAAVRH